MSDLEKILLGDAYEEYISKKKSFDERLLAIESKHIDFFKNRESIFDHEEHDRLHHHYIMRTEYNPTGVSFGFMENSALPVHIQQECERAFAEVWK